MGYLNNYLFVNFQLKPYVSWNRDLEAMCISALNMKLESLLVMLFFHLGFYREHFFLMEEVKMCHADPLWKTKLRCPKSRGLLIKSPKPNPNRKKFTVCSKSSTQWHEN